MLILRTKNNRYLLKEDFMGKCLKIGLMGGIGAGKSTILKYIQSNYNCLSIMTDVVAYNIIRNDKACLAEVEEIFKDCDIHDENGAISSAKIGKIIFKDDEKKKQMNAAVHPRVIDYVNKTYEEAVLSDTYDFVIIESALLVECGMDKSCDNVFYVTAPEDVRIRRLRAGRHYSKQKCLDIIKGQLSDEESRKHATDVIDSGVSHENSYKEVDAIFARLGICKLRVQSHRVEEVWEK